LVLARFALCRFAFLLMVAASPRLFMRLRKFTREGTGGNMYGYPTTRPVGPFRAVSLLRSSFEVAQLMPYRNER
jgi:hypothetical protein